MSIKIAIGEHVFRWMSTAQNGRAQVLNIERISGRSHSNYVHRASVLVNDDGDIFYWLWVGEHGVDSTVSMWSPPYSMPAGSTVEQAQAVVETMLRLGMDTGP